MKKYLIIVFLFLLCLACNSKEKNLHTFDEFKEAFNVDLVSIGTYFWDEFVEFEDQYNLTKGESKLLGEWMNVTFTSGPTYNYYAFFPNKLFISSLSFECFKLTESEKMYLNKALGIWEIIDDIVRITIYAIITEDDTMAYPNNKGLFFVEKPYTIDFININDIDERGFTQRPINDMILSKELQQKVTVQNPNKTNNLYVRNVYTIDVITNTGKPEKNYNYFSIVPDLARDNVSGFELATSPELIRKYIPNWWY